MCTEITAAWQACLEEAWWAYTAGSAPIGAVYADRDGSVLLRGRNRIAERAAPAPFLHGSRVAHAEINVLVQVPAAAYGDMAAGVLYTSLEPCPMCFGAALMSGVREIRFGARDPWAGSGNLAGASPYVASKGVRLVGPEPRVQAVSLVLLTEHTLRSGSPRAGEVVAAFAFADGAAAGLGREWLQSGHLQDAAREGMSIGEIADEIWRLLERG